MVDAEVNRANRRKISLTAHLTGRTGLYGPQGGVRPAATRQTSTLRHLAIARAVLSGDAKGIARDAERFFDPKVQDNQHAKYRRELAAMEAEGRGETPRRVHSCQALGTLKAWSYDLPRCRPFRCCADGLPPRDADHGPDPDAWVGPIAGVDAYRLMLMRPSSYGADHDRAFAEATEIIASRSGLPGAILNLAPQIGALLVLALLA